MSNSFLDALRQTAIISNILGGKTGQAGQGVTVPVEDKTAGPTPIGPNLAGPRVSMPGPPVTIGQPPPQQEASQPWFNPDTSSVGNFIMKGASGQGNLMDTVNSLAKPFYGTDVQGLGTIAQGIDRGTSGGMESVFPGMGAFLSNPLSAFGIGQGAGEGKQIPGMSAEESRAAWQQYMNQKNGVGQDGQGGDGLGALRALAGGGSSVANLGANPSLPAPPTEAAPAPIDLGGYQQWLEQAKPQDTDPKQMEQMLMANFLGGLGSGLSNASGGGTIGELLLSAGGGALQGVGKGKLDQNRAKEKDKEENRRYAGMRAEASLGEAQIKQKDAEAARQVDNRNQMRQYEHELRVIDEMKPKVLGASQDGLVYETNEGGVKKIHTINNGNSAKLALARAMGGKQMMMQAGKAMGPLGPLHALAQDALNSGMLDAIVTPEVFDTIKTNARDKMPGYQEGKASDAALNTYMEGELVQMMIKNEGLRNTLLQQFTMPVGDVPPDIVKPAEKKKGR